MNLSNSKKNYRIFQRIFQASIVEISSILFINITTLLSFPVLKMESTQTIYNNYQESILQVNQLEVMLRAKVSTRHEKEKELSKLELSTENLEKELLELRFVR